MKMQFKKRHWKQPGHGPCACPHSKNEPLEQDATPFLQGKERSHGPRFAIVSDPEVTIVSQRRVKP